MWNVKSMHGSPGTKCAVFWKKKKRQLNWKVSPGSDFSSSWSEYKMRAEVCVSQFLTCVLTCTSDFHTSLMNADNMPSVHLTPRDVVFFWPAAGLHQAV